VDILSIDVDGVDYWLWRAATAISPRIVIIEYNASFGPEASVTVPYEPEFDRTEKGVNGHYHGASITALARLANQKGYVLLGCDRAGANAFFLRADLLNDSLYEVPPSRAHRWSWHVFHAKEDSHAIRDELLSKPLVTV
jgi:hypothetical protein